MTTDHLDEQIELLKRKIDSRYRQSIDVGRGWYQIVLDCDHELTVIDQSYTLYQIKEKFGGLRYYMSSAHPSARDVVTWYEKRAATTCEVTGQPGVLMHRGLWLKTLSPGAVEADPWLSGYRPIT